MVIMLGFNLSQVSAQSMGPGMMGPGYGQDQQRGDWNYCPYCGNSLGPGYGYGMGYGMMGGYGMGPYMMGRGYYGMGPGMMYRGYGMGPGMMGYGYGMGYGMMGRGYGMGPGYGYPNAPGYQGPQYQQPAEPLKKKDAEKLLNNYLQSTRNPNLKLGKIEDKGDSFEAEIETKNGDLVDKIIVDKKTGGMHSAY